MKWQKYPSVTRTGKFFYRCAASDTTVMQSFLTGKWVIYGKSNLYFDSAKLAMEHAETP
jgi:hypothetical protein